jgi:protein tyrosine phosphatase (PTP) superfamily phosphohydrolase (DUF442 family)
LLAALAVRVPAGGQTSAPSTQAAPSRVAGSPSPALAARAQLPGLPQIAAVSHQLYRGAQPADRGFAELKKLGINIVVNLRHEPAEIVRERSLVEAQGMRYVSIPWRGKEDPKTEQVAQFLGLLHENPELKVFVHCERGAERTGVMVACYRMSREHWTPEQALNEMEAFRFRGLRFGHLKRFVRAFPGLLVSDPSLKPSVSVDLVFSPRRNLPFWNSRRRFVRLRTRGGPAFWSFPLISWLSVSQHTCTFDTQPEAVRRRIYHWIGVFLASRSRSSHDDLDRRDGRGSRNAPALANLVQMRARSRGAPGDVGRGGSRDMQIERQTAGDPALNLWRFSVMSTAVTMTAALAHLMELPAKMRFEPSLWVRLHRTMYPNFGRTAGPAEAAAVI